MNKLIFSAVAVIASTVSSHAQVVPQPALEYRPVQFSVVPGLSSNRKPSERYYSSFSFGVFGDRNGGVAGAQVSGLLNKSFYFNRGLQLAGLLNQIGTPPSGLLVPHRSKPDSLLETRQVFKGLQLGGLVNSVAGDVKGAQIGGVINTAQGELNGVQIGTINRTRHSRGLQVGVIT